MKETVQIKQQYLKAVTTDILKMSQSKHVEIPLKKIKLFLLHKLQDPRNTPFCYSE
mgnify:CR=1 FL=1